VSGTSFGLKISEPIQTTLAVAVTVMSAGKSHASSRTFGAGVSARDGVLASIVATPRTIAQRRRRGFKQITW
jgi:hypothetical protein